MLQAFGKYFFRGLLVVAPLAATIYVAQLLVREIDGWMRLELLTGRRVPGAGLVLTVALIALVGLLASNLATRWIVGAIDSAMSRLPLVRLLYTSIRDLVRAFVGDSRRFNRPVLVALTDERGVGVLGFLTREDLADFGLPGCSAVYLPQSYNFAGQLLVVPKDRVAAFSASGTAAMTLIVSGGVSGEAAAREARDSG